MAANALEEKINKIRQQNEEIRRRHEEVEEDKKNAAKLNALVQMVPSTDWPERKEPPEFSNPPKTNNKPKPTKEHHEHPQQHHSASGEGRKVHTFAQGQGPPPDPKYNFLADAEREEGNMENTKDNLPNKGQKHSKGNFKRKSGGKDGMQKDYRVTRSHRRDEHQPEYEAWRAERNRIDEDRISRQRTAEGNWRREWDNDKAHIVNEVTRSETKLGDYVKKDYKDFDRRHYVNGNDYASHNRSGYRSYRGNSRHFHNNYENRFNNAHHQEGHIKNSLSSNSDERTVVATDKSIKVTLNQGKGPVMSVKVNSLSIAGTGRVGPRQRNRVTYSSHSDVEVVSPDTESFSHPKSYDDKAKGNYHDNSQKFSNSRKSQPPKKKDFSNKSPYFRKKEIRRENANENSQKHHEIESPQKEHQKSQKFNQFKFQKPEDNIVMPLQNDEVVNKKENIISSDEFNASTEVKSKDNQIDSLNSCIEKSEEGAFAIEEGAFILQDSDLPMSKDEIETCKISEEVENKLDESQIIQTDTMSEYETTNTDLNVSLVKDINDNDRDKIKSVGNVSCDANNDIDKTILENKEHNSSMEKIEEILSNNCDSKQTEDLNEQENDFKLNIESSAEEKVETNNLIITSSTDVSSSTEQNNKIDSNDKSLKEKKTAAVEDKVTVVDDKINASNKQDVIKCTNKTEECKDENNDNENNVANSIAVDKVESQEEIHEYKK
ncbi:uncharacterized protein MAL13P1.304-like isoform X2 [Cataglyphis hispanica]|uniref:uncharacterized protein MAL13P1.304-like isoform X2 n=1 Tax=Cataglyphis hispanica TaxID=1086592 RepID=UPI00217F6C95|nr:uncharacterized protein MAL13P1.304-like isoform X2 [Cataglyphis hispanica]